jgi:formiminotetrahydrofolate cyclodeaminase
MHGLSPFLEELASSSPTPGGGSVAALSGALGASLVSMVCNLTIGKKKYVDVEADMRAVLKESEALRLELERLIDEDANAFDNVMSALKMPKETEEQKSLRKEALEKSMVEAATVPLAVMERCVRVAEIATVAAQKGNVNAVSDAGVAALLARAGTHSARLNVQINLPGIRSAEHSGFVERASKGVSELSAGADAAAAQVMEIVEGKLAA